MNILRLLPAIFSLLILSAHFSRAGLTSLSLIFLIIPFLLLIKQAWIARLIQALLILGSIEWIRSIFYYVSQRQAIGEPYIRLVIIIGIIALFTGLSALVFKKSALKERYKL